MKNLITLLICLITTLSFGQTLPIDSTSHKVVFKKIIELDSSYSSDVLYNLTKEWFTTNNREFNRSNSEKQNNSTNALIGVNKSTSSSSSLVQQLYNNETPLKFQDFETKKLIGKGISKYNGSTFGGIRVMYVEYDIKISVKESKIRVEITNFNYTHYNQVTMQQVQMYGWKDEGPCNSKNSIESLLTCDKIQPALNSFYTYLNDDINKFTESFISYIKSSPKQNDNW